jgi:hypothetical protein
MSSSPFGIEFRRPEIREAFRVCPTPGRHTDYALVHDPDNDDWFPIAENIRHAATNIRTVRVRLCENTSGGRFLWPIDLATVLPSDVGPTPAELVMATAAESVWCAQQETVEGCSFSTIPPGVYVEPVWGNHSFDDAIESAFWSKVIGSLSHPLLLSQRGAS